MNGYVDMIDINMDDGVRVLVEKSKWEDAVQKNKNFASKWYVELDWVAQM